jgi:osmotically-inducible protein OsmY
MKEWQLATAALLLSAAALTTGGCTVHRYDQNGGEYDTVTSQRVISTLHADAEYRFSMVEVATLKGTAYLSGQVDTYDHKRRAAEIARHVEGVSNVVNHVTVKADNN